MAVIFADGFDMYLSVSDMTQWVSSNQGSLQTSAITAFNTGQSYRTGGFAITAIFTSASNETTVYGSIRVNQAAGSNAQYGAFTFTDGGTAQCTIRWNGDGSIGLYSGAPTGTLIQTYTSIFIPGVWNSYQIKVVINNSTGSIEIRMNGATSNTITKTGVNTRGGTANSYVNGLSIIGSGVVPTFDDIFLNNTSGNAPTSWPGDVRAVMQNPATTTSTNFTVFPSPYPLIVVAPASNFSPTANSTFYLPFTAINGAISSVTFQMNANLTGNVKLAIYDSTGGSGAPGSVLASSSAINNPTVGGSTWTLGTPLVVTSGTKYYVAFDQDATANYKGTGLANMYSGTTTYSSFPVASPTNLTGPQSLSAPAATVNLTDNVTGVQELIEDGDTSYVYTSSIVEDKYSMSPISTAYTVLAMQYFAMYRRSDVGARTMQLSVAANGSSDTALYSDAAIPFTYTFKFATIENDPTGAAWTPAHANGAIMGLAVTA